MKYDAIIIGGGAAGLFCAAEAGKRGRRILLIEHNAQLGRKIVISGGGRCNFTNLNVKAENFISSNPHFAKSALARYTPDDFIKLVKKHRIKFYEKKFGQLFCYERSYPIVEMLEDECAKGGVEVLTDCSVKKISRSESFELETTKGKYSAKKIVVATGGLSFPKLGASDFGYNIAKQFGLKTTKLRPSLVALRFSENLGFSKLAGISVDVSARIDDIAFRENILFTHRGLSGPSVLQISNYWTPKKPILFDLLPDFDASELIENNRTSAQTVSKFLARYLPKRLAEEFTRRYFPNKPLKQLSNDEIRGISEMLNRWSVLFAATEGWDKAEVTLGGVDTDGISSQTLEAKDVPGLYFIGEVLDVTGWLGGYNFQWAWSSGYACGKAL